MQQTKKPELFPFATEATFPTPKPGLAIDEDLHRKAAQASELAARSRGFRGRLICQICHEDSCPYSRDL